MAFRILQDLQKTGMLSSTDPQGFERTFHLGAQKS